MCRPINTIYMLYEGTNSQHVENSPSTSLINRSIGVQHVDFASYLDPIAYLLLQGPKSQMFSPKPSYCTEQLPFQVHKDPIKIIIVSITSMLTICAHIIIYSIFKNEYSPSQTCAITTIQAIQALIWQRVNVIKPIP